MIVVIIALAIATATLTYVGLERLGRRAWIPIAFRSAAWAALGLLLVNLSCPAPGVPARPLVLLDASLSLTAAGGRWEEARDSAARLGEVRRFGDERATLDSAPSRGRSLLAPALLAASATDRPIIVVSDGEVEDQREIPPDILARSTVTLFPRTPRADLAITSVSGPLRVSAGDSIPLDITIESIAGKVRESVTVEVAAGPKALASRRVRFRGQPNARIRLILPPSRLGKGDHVLRVRLVGANDAEPRTDTRLHLVSVAPTPGVVLLASPADWDARFLYRALREVSELPVRGYVRLEAERWRSMTDLQPVPAQQVRQAARRADLLVLKGGVAALADGSLARGLWSWPSGEDGESPAAGDWYLSASDASPVAGAFLGQPLDSFPPALQLTPILPGPRDWVALSAQLGRRGALRPAIVGSQDGRTRRVTVAVDGLWRWAFRGGASEQTYRSWVAATASWLLGAADTARGVAHAIQPVVPNGRPVLFEWGGSGAPTPQVVTWSAVADSAGDVARRDTLRFDGSGRAAAWLPPGEYRYRLSGGGSGTVAVEEYSDELLPRPVSLSSHVGRPPRSDARTSARDWLWLFGVCVLGLSGEWLARRRLGLR